MSAEFQTGDLLDQSLAAWARFLDYFDTWVLWVKDCNKAISTTVLPQLKLLEIRDTCNSNVHVHKTKLE